MTGASNGFINLFANKVGNSCALQFHCIIHQEALCAKAENYELAPVMDLVVKIVNSIIARPLRHRQFKEFLLQMEAECGDLLLHNNIRWLSRGSVLNRFARCLPDLKAFCEEIGLISPELSDPEWLFKFYYLVDMTEHLNTLNKKLQGRGHTIFRLQQHVASFEKHLDLFLLDIASRNLLHFPQLRAFLQSVSNEYNPDYRRLEGFVKQTKDAFASRFSQFRTHQSTFKLVVRPQETDPFTVNVDFLGNTICVPDLQLQLLDLQSSMWAEKFIQLGRDLEDNERKHALANATSSTGLLCVREEEFLRFVCC
jgi:hypothetical protein